MLRFGMGAFCETIAGLEVLPWLNLIYNMPLFFV